MTAAEKVPVPGWPAPFDDALVDHGRDLMARHGGLLVVGPPGTGRLALARSIAAPGHLRIHRGTLAAASTPLYALRRLARHLDIHDDRSTADLALHLDSGRPADLPTLTVVLIGADLCDGPSLRTLLERAANHQIGLIGTIRPEALRHQPALSTAPTIQLPALGRHGVAHLLRQRFGREPDPVAVEFVHSRSQGIYDAVISVTESAVSLGLLAAVEDTLTLMPDPWDSADLPPVPLSAGSFHLHDLLDGGPELTDLLQIVALVDEVDVHELMAALPPGPLDLAVSHGVLKIEDGVVSFVLAAEAAAIDSAMTLPRRLEIHQQYQARFPRTFERPRAAMRAALCRRKVRRHVEPELAVRAARQANLEGLYREAVTITEPESPGEAVAGPMERAFALVELGEVPAIVELIESTDPAVLTDEELTDFILLRWTYLPPRADKDQDVLTGDAESVRRRTAVLQLARLWATAFQRGGPELESEARTLAFSGILGPLNTAICYLALSTLERNAGKPGHAVESARAALGLLRAVPTANAYVVEPAYEILAVALLDTLDFAAVEEILIAYSARTAPHGRIARMGHALWGSLEFRRGRVGLALTHARVCQESLSVHDPQQISTWVQAHTAELLAHHGLIDEAEALLETPDLQATLGRRQHDLEGRIALAAAFDATGHLDRAIILLQGVIAQAREADLRKAEIDAAATLVQIAGPVMVPELARAVAGLEDPTGVPEVWCRFVAAVEAEDMTALFALVAHLTDLGAVVLAAEISRFTLDFAGTGRELTAGQRLLLEHVAFAVSVD